MRVDDMNAEAAPVAVLQNRDEAARLDVFAANKGRKPRDAKPRHRSQTQCLGAGRHQAGGHSDLPVRVSPVPRPIETRRGLREGQCGQSREHLRRVGNAVSGEEVRACHDAKAASLRPISAVSSDGATRIATSKASCTRSTGRFVKSATTAMPGHEIDEERREVVLAQFDGRRHAERPTPLPVLGSHGALGLVDGFEDRQHLLEIELPSGVGRTDRVVLSRSRAPVRSSR